MRQRGFSKREGDMEANAKFWILARELNCFFARPAIHHQAGRREDAALMRLDDGAINRSGSAEIVRVYDQPAHQATP